MISDIDSTRIPPINRRGSDLKRQLFSVRSQFTKAYARWKKSGKNDPSLEPFLPVTRKRGDVSCTGRKLRILFQVMRCGHPDVRTHLVNFTVRTVPDDVMVDSGDKIG